MHATTLAGAATALALGLAIPAVTAGEPESADKDAKQQTVQFINDEGKSVGSAELTETPNGVLIDAKFEKLEPGWHGFHIHQYGKCETPDFKSAGGHFKPEGAKHGFRLIGGPHAGDLPNIHVDEDGRAQVQAFAQDVTLKPGKDSLNDSDGSALMVHAEPDDYVSQPSGDAGSRIACAEIGK